jgi:2-oxoacid:acceptor oxidoreductase delta subunit (pyruvate/2-ketoisovalerate family)
MPEARAKIVPWKAPQLLEDYPAWPHTPSGRLVEGHAAWRLQRPLLDQSLCTGCLQCYLLCPDAALAVEAGALAVDLRLCKGCGVCAKECKRSAIQMVLERS